MATYEFLLPMPIPPQLRVRKLIQRNGRIDSSSRITIEMPDTTVIGSQFEEFDTEILLSETVELVAACETGADYESVEFDTAIGFLKKYIGGHVEIVAVIKRGKEE